MGSSVGLKSFVARWNLLLANVLVKLFVSASKRESPNSSLSTSLIAAEFALYKTNSSSGSFSEITVLEGGRVEPLEEATKLLAGSSNCAYKSPARLSSKGYDGTMLSLLELWEKDMLRVRQTVFRPAGGDRDYI